jgi:hypothetical protein
MWARKANGALIAHIRNVRKMTTRNSEIAVKFANGKIMDCSKHMFIDGYTVYSYSHNYPIARKWGNIFLMNSISRSQTTKRHKSHVYQALKDKWKTIIFIPNCDIDRAYEQKEVNDKNIVKFKAKLIRARTKQSYYRSGIKNLIEQNRLIDEMIIPLVIAQKL